MLSHEGKQVEVALSVAHDARVIVELKEAQVAVVILHPLGLEIVAIVWRERVLLPLAFGGTGAVAVPREQALAALGTLAVGTTGGFHLDEAEVEPKLDFLGSVTADDLAHFDLTGLVRPFLQQVGEVDAHVLFQRLKGSAGFGLTGSRGSPDQTVVKTGQKVARVAPPLVNSCHASAPAIAVAAPALAAVVMDGSS